MNTDAALHLRYANENEGRGRDLLRDAESHRRIARRAIAKDLAAEHAPVALIEHILDRIERGLL